MISSPGVLDTYNVPLRVNFSVAASYSVSELSNFNRKSIEFWCGGFHLYARSHTRPFISAGGATGAFLGVNTSPSVLYSNSVSKIV